MDGWLSADGWMAGCLQMDGWLAVSRWMAGWLSADGWLAGCLQMDGWLAVCRWMDGWLSADGWMAGCLQMDGWLAVCSKYICEDILIRNGNLLLDLPSNGTPTSSLSRNWEWAVVVNIVIFNEVGGVYLAHSLVGIQEYLENSSQNIPLTNTLSCPRRT